MIVIAAAGLIAGVLAVIVAMGSGVLPERVYRAETVLAIVPAPVAPPPPTLKPGELPPTPAELEAELEEIRAGLWDKISAGTPSTVAAQFYLQTRFKDAAAKAAGVAPDELTATSTLLGTSVLIDVKLDAPTASAAETGLDAMVQAANPVVKAMLERYDVKVLQPAVDTAKAAGIPQGQLLLLIFLGGALFGSGIALVVTRARSRSRVEEPPPPVPPRRPPPRERADSRPRERRPAG
ncbi:hypothetical protein WEH80_34320 [Actinomycetes bacterium KLBMP 9759]